MAGSLHVDGERRAGRGAFNSGLGWAGLGVILGKLKPNCQGFLDSWCEVGVQAVAFSPNAHSYRKSVVTSRNHYAQVIVRQVKLRVFSGIVTC